MIIIVEIDLDKPREIIFDIESLIKLEEAGIKVPQDLAKGTSVKQLIPLLYFGLKHEDPITMNQSKELIEDYGYAIIQQVVDAALMECLVGKKNLKSKEKIKEVDTKNE